MKKILLLIIAFTMCAMLKTSASNLLVYNISGNIEQMMATGLIQNITFTSEAMIITPKEGESITIPFTALDYFTLSQTSSTQFLSKDAITVFPNPTNDVINVQCSMCNVQSIEIYDIAGKLLKTFAANATNINVDNLATGTYYLKVITDKGMSVNKIIKQN
jgi:hypothetical protein